MLPGNVLNPLPNAPNSPAVLPPKPAFLSIHVASRHPQFNPNSYDRDTHSYSPSYVNPTNYRVLLSACENLRSTVNPDDVNAFEWTVNEVGGAFTKSVVNKVAGSPFGNCTATVILQGRGRYEIILKVHLKNGTFLSSDRQFTLRDYLIVSLGDSMASGQGNPDQNGDTSFIGSGQCTFTTASIIAHEEAGVNINMDKDPIWQESQAYRSYKSGHSIAAKRLEGGERPITFLSFASSGAKVDKGLFSPQLNFQRVGQIAEAKEAIGNRTLNALIITIGVNDMGVIGTLTNLTKGKLGGKTINQIQAEAEMARNDLLANFDKLAAEITTQLKPRQVYITEYPVNLFAVDNAKLNNVDGGCGVFEAAGGGFLTITRNEAIAIHAIGARLNSAIREAANRHGWFVVDGIEAGFGTHGYCSEDSFYRGAEESCRMQGDFEGTIHPNEKGHAVIANQIASALNAHTFSLQETLALDGIQFPGGQVAAQQMAAPPPGGDRRG